jgi:hypothetical protein
VLLPDLTFQACNPHPRFTSRPDCFDFDLQASPPDIPDASPCVPGRVKFTVAGPTDRADELVATTKVGSTDTTSTIIELRLERVIGSMNGLFKATPGAQLGTIHTSAGLADHFDLGPALLPSEIGVRTAILLKPEP